MLLSWHVVAEGLTNCTIFCFRVSAGSGALFAWDIAELAPQQHWKVSERALAQEFGNDDDDSDSESSFIGEPGR
jgi:hypothetical protein